MCSLTADGVRSIAWLLQLALPLRTVLRTGLHTEVTASLSLLTPLRDDDHHAEGMFVIGDGVQLA